MPELTFAIRDSFRATIEDLQNSISRNDEMYHKTGDPNFAKFRDDNVRALTDIKEYILKREREEAERYSDGETQMELPL